MAHVWIPLPDTDSDVTEVAVPWKLLTREGPSAPSDFVRGTDSDDGAAFVGEDGAYVSARWPGDACLFARALLSRLTPAAPSAAPGP